jgi:hypothetical protein
VMKCPDPALVATSYYHANSGLFSSGEIAEAAKRHIPGDALVGARVEVEWSDEMGRDTRYEGRIVASATSIGDGNGNGGEDGGGGVGGQGGGTDTSVGLTQMVSHTVRYDDGSVHDYCLRQTSHRVLHSSALGNASTTGRGGGKRAGAGERGRPSIPNSTAANTTGAAGAGMEMEGGSTARFCVRMLVHRHAQQVGSERRNNVMAAERLVGRSVEIGWESTGPAGVGGGVPVWHREIGTVLDYRQTKGLHLIMLPPSSSSSPSFLSRASHLMTQSATR